jgi:nucleotide-binding universal stress UspA family protein
MSGIVVGVDGSPHSQNALDWAVNESALRHVPLTVLAVVPAAAAIWGITGQAPASEETHAAVKQAAEEMVDKSVARQGGQAVTVRTVDGVAADELIKASEGAELVIVGARGAGGFATLMMGSVSAQVARHSHCPVVVIPNEHAR